MRRLAQVISDVFNPPWVAVGSLGAVAFTSSSSTLSALGWWALAATFTSVLPLGFLIFTLRRGWAADRFVTRGDQRLRLAPVPLLLVAAGLALLVVLHAPRELQAAAAAGVGASAAGVALTGWKKLSFHAGTLTGAVLVLSAAVAPWLGSLGVLVPLVGWARVHTAHHSWDQVLLGTVVGGATTAAIYLPLAGVG